MSHDYVALLARQQGITLRNFQNESQAIEWVTTAPAGGSPSAIGPDPGRGPGAARSHRRQPRRRLTRPYSGVIPASFISFDHFAWSARMKRANSGVCPRCRLRGRAFLAHRALASSGSRLRILRDGRPGVAAARSRPTSPPLRSRADPIGHGRQSGQGSERFEPVRASPQSPSARVGIPSAPARKHKVHVAGERSVTACPVPL